MTVAAPAPPRRSAAADASRVRRLVLLSAVSLVAQSAVTDHPGSQTGPALLWLAVGAVLLWLVVRRRSRVAHGLVVAGALLGAGIYALAAVGGGVHAAVVAATYLGQGLPLLAAPVRRHVGAHV